MNPRSSDPCLPGGPAGRESPHPNSRTGVRAGRGGEKARGLSTQKEEYLVSQPGAVVPLHGEALGVPSQVCQGILVERDDR